MVMDMVIALGMGTVIFMAMATVTTVTNIPIEIIIGVIMMTAIAIGGIDVIISAGRPTRHLYEKYEFRLVG